MKNKSEMPLYGWIVSVIAGMFLAWMVLPLISSVVEAFQLLYTYGACALAGLFAWVMADRTAPDNHRNFIRVLAFTGIAFVWLMAITLAANFTAYRGLPSVFMSILILLPYGLGLGLLVEKLFR